MPIKQIGSAEAKYLVASDILIGDMSNTNYEFILFDRPIILLANKWLINNFPDIGIKTDLSGLKSAIERSIGNPNEYKKQRQYWLNKTIYKPDGKSSKRYLDIILKKSQIKNPQLVFIHGFNSVRKSNLEPLIEETKQRGLPFLYKGTVKKKSKNRDNTIYIAAHFKDLEIIPGYKVHIDHDFKGKATTNVEIAIKDYKKNNFFPWIDLHITAGEAGDERTKKVLGPLKDRTFIAGYPKADHLIKFNTIENKKKVFEEFNFNENKPLITYAPAGRQSYEKPGGSLTSKVIKELRKISIEKNFNILIKLKYSKKPIILRGINKVRKILRY